MGGLRWLGGVFTLTFLLVIVQADDFLDLPGPYCSAQNTCCNGRQDDCAVPIIGTICYCDDFCNSTDIDHDDCCPDYWSFCQGITTPPPPFTPTTPRRPLPTLDPLPLIKCEYKGINYQPAQPFMDNCNKCECVLRENTAEVECQHNLCLVTNEIVDGVNKERGLGWRASNYSQFWGRPLQEGIDLRLGTLQPQAIVMQMQPVIKIYDPSALPRHFDAEEKWPEFIHEVEDQGWCGSSWAISTTSVASDRFAIISQGLENVELSAQHILSCDRKNMKSGNSCSGGPLDRAWSFIKKYGLVDDDCFPYTAKYESCVVRRKGTLESAGCGQPPNRERKHRYRVGPAYRLRNETDVMYEIINSGPVQATLKVYHDFFSYHGGVYSPTQYGLYDPYGYHSVKIVGWGEENRRKYWKVANSWGPSWGENGYFRITRGSNECDIETFVLAVWPEIEREIHINSI